MTDIIIALIILVIVGAAVAYIVRQKRKGVKCIGCPHSSTCGSKGGCGGNCSGCGGSGSEL